MKSRASTSRSLETEREKRFVGRTRIEGGVGGKRGRERERERERERDKGEKGEKRAWRRKRGTSAKFLPNWGGTTTSTTTRTTPGDKIGAGVLFKRQTLFFVTDCAARWTGFSILASLASSGHGRATSICVRTERACFQDLLKDRSDSMTCVGFRSSIGGRVSIMRRDVRPGDKEFLLSRGKKLCRWIPRWETPFWYRFSTTDVENRVRYFESFPWQKVWVLWSYFT